MSASEQLLFIASKTGTNKYVLLSFIDLMFTDQNDFAQTYAEQSHKYYQVSETYSWFNSLYLKLLTL